MQSAGLLIDTNLLVLFTVGSVNLNRVENFKRTRQYTVADFKLLRDVVARWPKLYTTPHVLAEVSNLTDLSGAERNIAREFLKITIAQLLEPELSSTKAAEDSAYMSHGLTDASIAATARAHDVTVLTDDLDLYLRLQRDGIVCANFTYLRAHMLGF